MALEIESREPRIERYFPDVLANAKEFMTLGAIVDPELKLTWQALIKQMLNTFVYDLDKDGASRWEDMLQLHPGAGDSLSVRKQRILARINATLPYTFRSFQNMLNALYGDGKVVELLNADEYELWLDLAAEVTFKNAEIRKLARVIIPANLDIKISNTKSVNVKQYTGFVLSVTHSTTIEAEKEPHLTGDYPIAEYPAGIIYTCKHITIGGQ